MKWRKIIKVLYEFIIINKLANILSVKHFIDSAPERIEAEAT